MGWHRSRFGHRIRAMSTISMRWKHSLMNFLQRTHHLLTHSYNASGNAANAKLPSHIWWLWRPRGGASNGDWKQLRLLRCPPYMVLVGFDMWTIALFTKFKVRCWDSTSPTRNSVDAVSECIFVDFYKKTCLLTVLVRYHEQNRTTQQHTSILRNSVI